jgi:hypoxanthine phosphoribosyltransferase
MHEHRLEVLISEASLEQRVAELTAQIAADSDGEPLVLVGILRGSFVFLADLIRSLHRRGVRSRIDFMILESYGSGTESAGTIHLARDISLEVQGRQVMIVDDILDSGRTLSFAVGRLRARGAARVRTCVLLDKPSRRIVPFTADYCGFTVPDAFVVGYGLDYDHAYRELPWIAQVVFPDTATGTAQ